MSKWDPRLGHSVLKSSKCLIFPWCLEWTWHNYAIHQGTQRGDYCEVSSQSSLTYPSDLNLILGLIHYCSVWEFNWKPKKALQFRSLELSRGPRHKKIVPADKYSIYYTNCKDFHPFGHRMCSGFLRLSMTHKQPSFLTVCTTHGSASACPSSLPETVQEWHETSFSYLCLTSPCYVDTS